MKSSRTAHYTPGPVSCSEQPFQACLEERLMQSLIFLFKSEKVLGLYHYFK